MQILLKNLSATANRRVFFAAVMLGASLTIPAQASVIDITPTDDSYVMSDDQNGVFGSERELAVGAAWDYYAPYRICRSYLKFNLAGELAPGVTIVDARLFLYTTGGLEPITVGAHNLAADNWSEASINWANAPTGFAGIATDAIEIDGSGGSQNWEVTVDVAGAFLGDGVYSVVMKSASEGTGLWITFDSKEFPPSIIRHRPFLRVNYDPPTAVSPSTWGKVKVLYL